MDGVAEQSLREIRKSKGSQLDVYVATGISPSMMSLYERGLVIPSMKTSMKLSPYLGISPAEIQILALKAREARVS